MLTCLTNDSSVQILRWTVILPQSNSAYSRSVPITGSGVLEPFSFNAMTVIAFSRISEADSHPFIAKLYIDRVTNDLNQTEIHCLTVSGSAETIQMSVIHVLGGKIDFIVITL